MASPYVGRALHIPRGLVKRDRYSIWTTDECVPRATLHGFTPEEPAVVWDHERTCNPVVSCGWPSSPMRTNFARDLWNRDRKRHEAWTKEFAWVFRLRHTPVTSES